MRIGDLARALGVSRDTVLRLEARGVIHPARDWAGHRRFSREDVERVRELLFQHSAVDGVTTTSDQPTLPPGHLARDHAAGRRRIAREAARLAGGGR